MKASMDSDEIRSTGDLSAPKVSPNSRILWLMGGIVGLTLISIITAIIFVIPRKAPGAGASAPAVAAPAAEPVLVEFDKLKGKWLRPDGGYVIEIKQLLPQNDLEVAYFNPNPIHVGKARLYKERGFVKVFVELQDVNYPGSTYTLIYDRENDLLRGVYYQATQQQEYQIEFERLPPGS